jgi:hypothetical protein
MFQPRRVTIPTMSPSNPPIPAAPASRGPIAALRQFARARPAAAAPEERCDLCAAPLAPEHQHLVEPAARRLLCACDACAILFDGGEATKYRRVPRRVEAWPDFRLADERWAGLGIPIGLAFLFHSTPAGGPVAVYPSPAGGTEAPLAAAAWELLAEDNPALRRLAPDVEALLVNRIGTARDYYRAPIDECYRLAGLVRTHWRGLSGGAAVWGEIAAFFDRLRARAVAGARHSEAKHGGARPYG